MSTAGAGFPTGQAARLAKVPYRTVAYWDTSHFLEPSLATAAGKGTRRSYSFLDVVMLRVAGELRRGGVSLQSIRKVVDRLRAQGVEAPLAHTLLVSDGTDVFLVEDDQLVSVLRQPGQRAFMW